jgi:hypothetical protein
MSIVKVKFKVNGRKITMMFGDSYKSWREQLREFMDYHKHYIVESAWQSTSKWIGWGGLKWCDESIFQLQLNREGCQVGEPMNPKPREYLKMEFREIIL